MYFQNSLKNSIHLYCKVPNICFLLVGLLLISAPALNGQEVVWKYYFGKTPIKAIEDNNHYSWVGTESGLIRIDKKTGEREFYTQGNSKLPDNNITDIEITSKGVIWLTTGGGAVRIKDGKWKNYTTSNSGLSETWLYEAAIHKGKVWFLTKQRTRNDTEVKLSVYDGTTWHAFKKPLQSAQLTDLVIDNKGSKWIGTKDNGLIELTTNRLWNVYSEFTSPLENNKIKALISSDKGNIWLLNEGYGLIQIDGGNWTKYNQYNSDLPDENVRGLEQDKSGNIWVSTAYRGIAKFDGQNWRVFNGSQNEVNYDSLNQIHASNTGNLWFGGRKSDLIKYDGSSWEKMPVIKSNLPGEKIIDIVINRQDSVKWIATRKAITSFKNGNWKVHDQKNSQLPDVSISSLKLDNKGRPWVITIGGGVCFYDYDTDQWEVLNKTNSKIPSDNISSLVFDGKGNAWMGTDNDGVAKYDGNKWDILNTSNTNLHTNQISDIAINKQSGEKWMATSSGIIDFDGNYFLAQNDIKEVAIQNDTMWAVTSNNGVAYNGPNQNRWQFYDESYSYFPTNLILDLSFDHQGTPWLSTLGGGVLKFKDDRWYAFHTDNSGLMANTIRGMAEAANGYKWFATKSGLAIKTTKNKEEDDNTGLSKTSSSSAKVFPNPFSDHTKVAFSLGKNQPVKLTIYDGKGVPVQNLDKGYLAKGEHQIKLNMKDKPEGTYFLILQKGVNKNIRKTLLHTN